MTDRQPGANYGPFDDGVLLAAAEKRCLSLVEGIERELGQCGEWRGYGGALPDGRHDPRDRATELWEPLLARRSERLHRQYQVTLWEERDGLAEEDLVVAFVSNVDDVEHLPPRLIWPALCMHFRMNDRTLDTVSRLLRRWMNPSTTWTQMRDYIWSDPPGLASSDA